MANFNLNKVIMGGRITADIEPKQTPSGVAVAQFAIAINRRGSKDEKQVDFFNCIAYRNTAEFITKYFRKGSSICIVGSIQNRTWTDKGGVKRYATEIIVDEANFVDSKSDSASASESIPEYTSTSPAPNFADIPQDDDLPF
jgi:single-strand DNA-binding protein